LIDAVDDSRVLFCCAKKHPHWLVLGSHSVNTNEASLARGVARIGDVAAELRRARRL
jgi:hypothetical protein